MGRRYSVPFSGTLTNAGGDSDLLSIQPADDKPVQLVGMKLCQTSEVKDAEEEGLRITIRRLGATFTVGSGGSAITPVPYDDINAAAGCTTRCNDTTVSTTSGTNTVCEEIGWNVRNTPLEIVWPDPVARWVVRQASGLIIRCETTPLDDISIAITFDIEEL